MTHSAISLGVGLGGGKASTSSGRLPSGGGALQNLLSTSLDGANDYLDLGSSTTYINTASAFSVSAWFNVDNLGSYPTICALKTNQSNAFVLALSNVSGANQIYNGVWFGSAPTGDTNQIKGFATANTTLATAISSGWHHLVFTYDGDDPQAASSSTVYIDGVEYASTQAVGLPSYSNSNNYIARSPTGFYFDGFIDEFAIFNSELSSSDVTAIYNSGTPADLSSLSPVGWYRMGDGTGDTDSGGGAPASGDTIGTVADQGSGGNNATGTNGPTYSSTVPS